MSATLTRLKKRAAELEQKKQFDRALEVYLQILEEGGKELPDDDVPLFNRVGDMLMRKGNVTEALGYYERAVDVYAERGFLNNAIALCSKILRQSPGRTAVYYKLGRISARKGFKSDARKNFLEYADRMQKAGMADEAFRALKEFAALYPDQDDVRLILAELLSKENRKGEALEQLQALYEKLEAEGRKAEARATVDRMKAIDPTLTPRVTGAHQAIAPSDLVFLDLSETGPRTPVARAALPTPPPAPRAPTPPPVPALDGLTVTFVPDDEPEESVPLGHPDGFEATVVDEPATAPASPESSHDRVEPMEGLVDGMASEHDVEPLPDLVPTASEDAALVAPLLDQPPMSGSEFAGLDLEEAPRRAASRPHDLVLPGDLPRTPEVAMMIGGTPGSVASIADALVATGEDADVHADASARDAIERSAPPGAAAVPEPEPTPEGMDVQVPGDAETGDEDAEGLYFGAADTDAGDESAAFMPSDDDVAGGTAGEAEAELVAEDAAVVADVAPTGHGAVAAESYDTGGADHDFLSEPPGFGASGDVATHAFPPLDGLEAGEEAAGEPPAVEPEAIRLHTPRSTLSIGGAERHLRQRLELEPEDWGLRRQLGEALLDTGRRDDGLYELELAMVGFELDEDIDHAAEVVDEILGVSPTSIRHHQKRVEYAVRARDRARLIHAYLELADALFRTGTADKAVSVYGRVLELDGSNERAEFALATLAPDELIRRRGGAQRPERWSDELDAIPGSGIRASGAMPAVPAPGSPVSIDAVVQAVGAARDLDAAAGPADAPPDTEGDDTVSVEDLAFAESDPEAAPVADDASLDEGLETAGLDPAVLAGLAAGGAAPEATEDVEDLPEPQEGPVAGEAAEWDEDRWGTGEAVPSMAWDAVVVEEVEADVRGEPGQPPGELPVTPDESGEPTPAAAVAPMAETPADTRFQAASAGGDAADEEPGPVVETGSEPGEGREASRAEARPVDAAGILDADVPDRPAPEDVSPVPVAPSRGTPEWSGQARATPGWSDVEPATPPSVPRRATPARGDAGLSRLERARRLTPASAAESDFVDLGEWLRQTEPEKSTRMMVEDPQPTGDEQADFAELLRRFKRGVAENVEAEDYEAHYDLGVAYKEMGLVDEAIAQFQKALRGTTQRVRSYEALGQCFVEKAQYPIAAALLQRATELPGTDDQQLVGVLYLLGFANEHMGRPAAALPCYLRVFAVDIEFRDIAARVAALGTPTQ